MNETGIINKAIYNLNRDTKIEVLWQPDTPETDGEINIWVNGKTEKLTVEVKKELRDFHIPVLEEMKRRYPQFIIIAERIFPKLKEKLRENQINYLDGAGNIYINTPRIFLWLDGKKDEQPARPATNRAFTKTGLKTVFYLLLNNDAVNMPYRRLAEITGVALGNIKNIIEGLKEAGFILQVNKTTLQLINKKMLLTRWVTGYDEALKPALLVGKFRLWNKEQHYEEQIKLLAGTTLLGGEPAAEFYTGYLKPQVITVYTAEHRNTIIPAWKMVPDPNGKVEVYEKFWKEDPGGHTVYAPPLLVYADLELTGDPRCREAALRIYDLFLKEQLEND